MAGGLLLNVLMKLAFHRARPVFDDPLLTLSTYSFPSGHVAGSTILYGLVVVWVFGHTRRRSRRLLAVAGAFAAIGLVAFSRMYLGVHYLSDVSAAFAEGVAWLALCLSAFAAFWREAPTVAARPGPRRRRERRHEAGTIAVIVNAGSGCRPRPRRRRPAASGVRAGGPAGRDRAGPRRRGDRRRRDCGASPDAPTSSSPEAATARISSVGAALVDTGVALGVLPLGTLNHFAKDLGIPLDLEQAVDRIVHGRPLRIDVGEVNGHVFLNNSSLGLYPDIVRERVRQQRRLGRSKWMAMAWASLAALRRYTFMKVRLSDGRRWKARGARRSSSSATTSTGWKASRSANAPACRTAD